MIKIVIFEIQMVGPETSLVMNFGILFLSQRKIICDEKVCQRQHDIQKTTFIHFNLKFKLIHPCVQAKVKVPPGLNDVEPALVIKPTAS